MSPVITVAICTFNRHPLLPDAIEAVLRQTLDRRMFKVLIVDNSSDRVAADAFYRSARFDPIVSVTWSSPPGVSRARNLATNVCDTPYIAFLDDDARPEPSWLAGLLDGFGHSPKVAIVGGPIVPIWRSGRPSWLPQKHLGMLTVLNALDDDRDLAAYEYLWCANMAFVVERLRAVGGFPEQIGRKGISLLSCEELPPQDALRAAGYVVRFVNAASVRHIVHDDRLRRDWMRSRIIWQGVSELMQDPPQFDKGRAIAEIRRLGEHDPDVRAAARLFFKDAEGEALDNQLDLILHFSELLMWAHRSPEPIKEVDFLLPSMTPPAEHDDYATVTESYSPSASGTSDAHFLFVEGTPGHRHFFDLFGEIDGARLLTPYTNDQAWSWQSSSKAAIKSSLQYIHRSIGRQMKAIFFVTFDPLTYGPSSDEFMRFIRACRIPIFGILHRMPDSPTQVENLQSLHSLVDRIFFLSETMTAHARSTMGLNKAYYLPHHPTTFAYPNAVFARDELRTKMGVGPDQVVFGMVGEARRGKGINLLLSTFEHIPPSQRERMFFVFAGKARDHSNDEVRQALINARVMGLADLRSRSGDSNYKVLSEREYAEYIAATDVGLLLYQDGQRNCMSGVLGDFVWANRNIIATADSYVGAEVRKHSLGMTLNEESASALAATLAEALNLPSISSLPRAREYRERISPQTVLEKLRQLIDLNDAGSKQQDSSTQASSGRLREVDDYAA